MRQSPDSAPSRRRRKLIPTSMPSDSSSESRRKFMRSSMQRLAKLGLELVGSQPGQPKRSAPPPTPSVPPRPPEPHCRNQSPDMDYAELGRTSMMVSRIAAEFSGLRPDNTDLAIRALDRGLNLLLANHRAGESEVALARLLGSDRDRFWICSKASPFITSADIEAAQHDPNAVMAFWDSLDSTLARFQTDRIDVYMLQAIDAAWRVRDEAMLEALSRAKEQGKIRHIGVSTHRNVTDVVEAAIDARIFSIVEFPLSPVTLTLFEPLVDQLRENDIGLIGGLPSIGLQKPETIDLRELPADWTADQLALLYMMKRVPEASFAVGIESDTTLERMTPLAKYEPMVSELNELYAVVENELWPHCADCGRQRVPSMASLEAVFEADYRARDPWKAPPRRAADLIVCDDADKPMIVCPECLAERRAAAETDSNNESTMS